MQHFNLAVVLYDAGHVPGGRRRKDVYDYIGGLYVDFPYRLQLYSGALYGNGGIRRLGSHDRRLDRPRRLFSSPAEKRKMETSGYRVTWNS